MAQAGLDVSGETDGGDGTDLPAFVPLVKVGKALYEGDSIQYVELNPLAVYPQLVFKNDKQRQAYNRLVANVKKVLPIAKEVNHIIIETYDFLQTLPNKKAKDEHLKRVERGIRAEYTPRMKKLTYSQGKTAHQTGLPRVRLVVVSAGAGVPRSDTCGLLPGVRCALRRFAHEEVRPEWRRPIHGANSKTSGSRTNLSNY